MPKWTKKDPRTRNPNTTTEEENRRKVNEIGTDEDPHCDEVSVVAVVLQTSPHKESLTTRYMRSGADSETIEISDVQIDSTTEAFATVQMPAEIGPNKLVILKCKVDTGAGGNVMPLHAFAKLLPRSINADGSPRGLKSSMTYLTAYNGSKIPQFRTLDTAIDWTPKGKDVANHLQTMMVHSRHTGTSNPRTPIMCQTWHCGSSTVQSTSRRENWCSRRNLPQKVGMSIKTFNTSTHHLST